MTAEEFIKDKRRLQNSNCKAICEDTVISSMQEYAKQKCQELLLIVAEKAKIKVMKKSQFGKSRKWQKVKEGEEIDLFSYEMQSSVDKESILNAVDLDSFIS